MRPRLYQKSTLHPPLPPFFEIVTDLLRVYRASSQKPRDELYEIFRQHFPAIGGAAGPSTSTTSGDSNRRIPTVGDNAVDVASQDR